MLMQLNKPHVAFRRSKELEILVDPDRRRLHDEEMFRERCRTAPHAHGLQRPNPNEMSTAHMVDEMLRVHREEQRERPGEGRLGTNRLVEQICSLYRDQLESLADALGVPRRGLQSRDALLTVLFARLCPTGLQGPHGSSDSNSLRLQRRAHAWLARERAVQSRSRTVHSFMQHRERRDLVSR